MRLRIALAHLFSAAPVSPARAPSAPAVERLPQNPIIRPEMLPRDDGSDINGPSLIRVPDWVQPRLGRYYLYFAHHKGTYIRMAYAEALEGPWRIYGPGTLHIEETVCDRPPPGTVKQRHIGSPDVHVDAVRHEIQMYFHGWVFVGGDPSGKSAYRQQTLLALSGDGLRFDAGTEALGDPYFRAFRWAGMTYAMAMPGVVYRSADGLGGFVRGPTLFSDRMRHAALRVEGDVLSVFYTEVGDDPERILLSRVPLTPDWMRWQAGAPVEVLRPERDWEGVGCPPAPSRRGVVYDPVRQLRDPGLFEEAGDSYLLYTVAGERGIAIARLRWALP